MPEIDKKGLDRWENLLQDTLKSNAEVLKAISDIKKYMRWQQIWSALRLFIIFVPIVLGFIYLPPIIQNALQNYRNLLN